MSCWQGKVTRSALLTHLHGRAPVAQQLRESVWIFFFATQRLGVWRQRRVTHDIMESIWMKVPGMQPCTHSTNSFIYQNNAKERNMNNPRKVSAKLIRCHKLYDYSRSCRRSNLRKTTHRTHKMINQVRQQLLGNPIKC